MMMTMMRLVQGNLEKKKEYTREKKKNLSELLTIMKGVLTELK